MLQELPAVYIHICPVTLLVSRTSLYAMTSLNTSRDNGLFRYWTISNIPLFLISAPTLTLLVASSVQCISTTWRPVQSSYQHELATNLYLPACMRLASPQLILAILVIVKHHVQIITRLSSGYPWWYMWLAFVLQNRSAQLPGRSIVQWMMIYAFIQAGLFASFLPPA